MQFASAAKQETQAVQCSDRFGGLLSVEPGSQRWAGQRPGTRQCPAWAIHTFQFSSFVLTHPLAPSASTFVHVHVHDHFDHSRYAVEVHLFAPPHSFSPCPFASHTGLTPSLSLPVLLLVTICVCLEIALRTCCSRLGKSELMTDRISSQTRNSHAHHARKSRPASPEHQTPES